MTIGSSLCIAAAVSLLAGLDRTAVLQLMISRPIVAAPLAGWLLGNAAIGLEIGAFLELLWLGRIPVGASIPPDDTQVAIGCTFLAITQYPGPPVAATVFSILCLLAALPFGRIGGFFDRLARRRNECLWMRAQRALDEQRYGVVNWLHLQGALHFGMASLLTLGVVLLGGFVGIRVFTPVLASGPTDISPWLRMAVPLAGIAACLGTVNFRKSGWFYVLSFMVVYSLLLVSG